MGEQHTSGLNKHCRVCGGRLQKAKGKNPAPVHPCGKYRDGLYSAFAIDVNNDSPHIHPAQFCNCCYSAMQKHKMALKKGKEYQSSFSIFLWEEHSAQCMVSSVS